MLVVESVSPIWLTDRGVGPGCSPCLLQIVSEMVVPMDIDCNESCRCII